MHRTYGDSGYIELITYHTAEGIQNTDIHIIALEVGIGDTQHDRFKLINQVSWEIAFVVLGDAVHALSHQSSIVNGDGIIVIQIGARSGREGVIYYLYHINSRIEWICLTVAAEVACYGYSVAIAFAIHLC